MGDFEKFKQKRKLQEPAENTKKAVVGVLILSVVIFAIIGAANVKPIIWYWATFMTLLLIGCAIQDIIVTKKINKL